MKVEDFLDNYEYKVTKRLLKKEFPYVINILPTENFEQYETLSFVFVVINPHKFIETYKDLGLSIPGYLSHLNDSFIPEYVFGASLGFFFTYNKSGHSGQSVNIGKWEISPDFKSIQNEIGDTITSVHNSGSIPKDLKLKAEIAVSGYMIPKKLLNK